METTQSSTETDQSLPSSPHPDFENNSPKNSSVRRSFFYEFIGVILGLILVAASLAGGYYLYKANNKSAAPNSPLQALKQLLNQNNNSENSTSPSDARSANTGSQANPQSPQSSQPTSVSTGQQQNSPGSPTNSKTYTDSASKFTFSYPADMQLSQASQGLGVETIELRSSDNTDKANAPDFQFLVFPKTLGRLIGQDFDATYALPDNTTKTIKDAQGNSQDFTKLQNRTINGLRAFDYKSTSNPPDPNTEAEVGTYIEIGGSVAIVSTGESDKGALEQILNTFKYPI